MKKNKNIIAFYYLTEEYLIIIPESRLLLGIE